MISIAVQQVLKLNLSLKVFAIVFFAKSFYLFILSSLYRVVSLVNQNCFAREPCVIVQLENIVKQKLNTVKYYNI